MTSGFGLAGQPIELIEALIDIGPKDLTIINNNAASGDRGLTNLLLSGLVTKMICSFPRANNSKVFEELYKAGKVELELVPQGNLACRIQAAGAGLGAILRHGLRYRLLKAKKPAISMARTMCWNIQFMRTYALVYGNQADQWSNLTYRKAARNFGR